MHFKPESEQERQEGRGTLFVVATPIGNLEDITFRALNILRSVDIVAAEDTRHTRKLLSYFEISKPLTSYHSHSPLEKGQALIERLEKGQSVALVTDAGTPGISDPGVVLIGDAISRGLEVVSIPGPAALISALVVSCLSTHPFAFLGFPPVKGSPRRRYFQDHAALQMTLILYESPQRLLRTLEDIRRHWGERRVVVARELTKKFEEIFRGAISEAMEHFAGGAKGEIALVVEGCLEGASRAVEQAEDWEDALRQQLLVDGLTVREASNRIAKTHELSHRMVYQEALRIRKEADRG